MAVLIDGVRERVLRIGEPHPLVGLLTEPGFDAEPDRPAFLLLNAGILHRVGPSRMNVMLARTLAADGHPVFRFDFSGIGDSGHRSDGKTFDERSVEEVGEVMDHLQDTLGATRFIVLGLCSGADAAYAAALADPRVVGMVALDGHSYRTWRYWLHRFGPRLLRGESWMNLLTGRTYVGAMLRRLRRKRSGATPDLQEVEVFRRDFPPRAQVADGYRSLIRRRVHMLQIFTGGIEPMYNYPTQFKDAFSSVEWGSTLRLEYFPASDHTFTDSRERRALIELVRDWAAGSFSRSRATRVTSG